jgi:polyketide biosynthesis acyl carrier protein
MSTVDARARMAELDRNTVAEILPGVPRSAMTGDRHPKDLGADSVDRVEIILALIDRVGVREPMAAFSELPDLDALVDFLLSKEKEGAGHAVRH